MDVSTIGNISNSLSHKELGVNMDFPSAAIYFISFKDKFYYYNSFWVSLYVNSLEKCLFFLVLCAFEDEKANIWPQGY